MDATTTGTAAAGAGAGAPPPPAQPGVPVHRYHSGGGASFGPLIVALAVITVLGALAVLMGRVCFGRRTVFGYGRYDLEAWVETKCASCVDGRMDVALPRPRHRVVVQPPAPPPPPPVVTSPGEAQPPPAEAAEEKEPEQPPGPHSDS